MGYARSPFREIESHLRIVVGLDEGDIQLIFKQYNSNFVFYQTAFGNYSIKDTSEAVYTMGDHEGSLQSKYDDISKKTRNTLSRI